MKKIVLSSIVLAAIFTGCGSSSSCCDADASKENNKELSTNIPPVATITGLADNTRISTGQSITVNGTSSSDRDGSVTAYNWSVDGVATSTATNPTFTFDSAGEHKICLTVTDNDNLNSANVECRTVIVDAPANTPVTPTAVITLTDSDAPLALYSEHTFSCADSHDNDTLGTGAEIVACDWDIRSYRILDGVEVAYRNCTHEAMEGNPVQICGLVSRIVATLTVTDNDGQTASTTTEYTEFSE